MKMNLLFKKICNQIGVAVLTLLVAFSSMVYAQPLRSPASIQVATIADNVAGHTRSKNIFVDASLPNAEQLSAAAALTDSRVFHVFSHGRPGQLLIEGRWLGGGQLVTFLQGQLKNHNVDQLNIYGCEFAMGTQGQHAVDYLEKELGMRISASTNITGKDGDWTLEAGSVNGIAGLEKYPYNLQVCGVDIHIANDNSGSVDSRENQQSRAFVSQLGLAFGPLGTGSTQSRISVSTWATGNNFQRYSFPSAGANFTTSLADVVSYASSPRTLSGGTDVYKALLTARTWASTNPIPGRTAPRVIVLMTDAFCNQISSNIVSLATQLKSQGFYIVVMAVDAASPCTILQGTNVASPGGYFSASSYNVLFNSAISLINSIRANTCASAPPAPFDLTVSLSNFQITNCATTPAASVNYTVTNVSTGSVFNNNLRIAFYNGNPTLPTTQHLFTVDAGTQNISANGGFYNNSVANAALLNNSTLYAVVNYNGALAGNAPPLAFSTLLSKLVISGEASAANNIGGPIARTDGAGCVPAANIDVRVTNSGQACDNAIIYFVKICNTGNTGGTVSAITAYPPPAFTAIGGAVLVGPNPFVGITLPAGACANYEYNYSLNGAVAGTNYDFSVGILGNDPSTNGSAVVSGYVCNTASAGTMTAGTLVAGVTQTITATVATVGTYNISTTANGVTFAGSGTFAGTGAQNVVLTATGTPAVAPAFPHTFTYTLNTTPNCDFTRIVLSAGDVLSTGGRLWKDRNLGASQVATSSTDAASYGHYYQWGRLTDGHQIPTSGTTPTLSGSDNPGNALFIIVNATPFDWRSGQNNTLWQGASGINNPCPTGYRLPTEAELDAERLAFSSQNAAGAFGSPLKLPTPGFRDPTFSPAPLGFVGQFGFYWSSTVSGTEVRYLNFGGGSLSIASSRRSNGFPVRCIKN